MPDDAPNNVIALPASWPQALAYLSDVLGTTAEELVSWLNLARALPREQGMRLLEIRILQALRNKLRNDLTKGA